MALRPLKGGMLRKIYHSLFCCLIMQIVFCLNGGVDYKVGGMVVKSAERIVFSTHQRALQISSAFSHIKGEGGTQS